MKLAFLFLTFSAAVFAKDPAQVLDEDPRGSGPAVQQELYAALGTFISVHPTATAAPPKNTSDCEPDSLLTSAAAYQIHLDEINSCTEDPSQHGIVAQLGEIFLGKPTPKPLNPAVSREITDFLVNTLLPCEAKLDVRIPVVVQTEKAGLRLLRSYNIQQGRCDQKQPVLARDEVRALAKASDADTKQSPSTATAPEQKSATAVSVH